MNHKETLSPALWQERLQGVLRALTVEGRQNAHSQIEHLLRQAFYLSCIAPYPFTRAIRPQCCEEDFEQLLECGGPDAAAMQLIRSDIARTLSGLENRGRIEPSELSFLNSRFHDSAEAVARDILTTWVGEMLRLSQSLDENFGKCETDQVVQLSSIAHRL